MARLRVAQRVGGLIGLIEGGMVHRVRVLIAEGHPPLREALRKFVSGSEGVDVVSEAANGNEAISASRASEPDIALVDSGLADPNAFAVTRMIREASPHTKVVIVADEDSEDYWAAAQDAGASAYIAKERVDRDLLAIIRSLLR